ncbi:hypothetical protein NDU88_005029 [Pleurodeles waltl]|uniref:Uncharacterized protein n=1 Tax=Pleurodeles waltl TaxID=8319 RepID=A0AAV7MWU7_PLEWA|nr:hypothetical protein NDU88_005029 [Pleurodeles waltl]
MLHYTGDELGRPSQWKTTSQLLPYSKSDRSRGPEPRLLQVRPQVTRRTRPLRRLQPPRVHERWLRGRIQLQGLIQQ